MGAMTCCVGMRPIKSENNLLYQINRYVKSDQKNTQFINDSQRDNQLSKSPKNNQLKNSTNKKQFLKNKKGEFVLLIYDPEEDCYQELKVNLPVIKNIEGMSELNMDKNLFLCGISPKQENEGSFLLRINIDKYSSGKDDMLNADLLINSHYEHIYPSLIHDRKGNILCIGGKGQKYCERYDINASKWFPLPQLVEERYKCTLCLDNKGNYVYLFGGIKTDPFLKNNGNENEDNTQIKILRMHLERLLIWENLIVKTNQRNLCINRISSGAFTFKNDEDFIFIVGGEDFDENCLDDVLRLSVKTLKIESTNVKLKNKTKFFNQIGVPINDQSYCFIDCFNQTHIIERNDCLPMDYQMDNI